MIGAIFGDIVGSPYEFNHNNIKTTEFPLLNNRSEFTDDSVMTVAVAAALEETYGQSDDAIRAALVSKMQEYGKLYPDAGYGGRFRGWLNDSDPQPYNSYGNGSAMRVSPAGWLYLTLDATLHAARLTAEVTHNHPEGIKGAEATATAIFFARCKADKDFIQSYIEDEYGYDLHTTLAQIRPTYHMDESCQGSVPQAIRAFLEGTDYESVIRLAVSIGGDSDTIACIAGGIAEAYYGMPEHLKKEALAHLDDRLRKQVQAFRTFYHAHSGKPTEDWEAAAKLMKQSPYTTGLPDVENALSNCYLDQENSDVIPVFNAIAVAMQHDAEIILPFSVSEEAGAQLFPDGVENAKQGDIIKPNEDVHFQLQQIPLEDGFYLAPAFTSDDEVGKGPQTSTMPQLLREFLDVAKTWEHCRGVVINPWSNKFILEKDAIVSILQYEPKSHISVIQADITKMHVDAIVNAANESCLGGGGVDGAIHKAAGPDLLKECRTLHGCNTGEAKVTKAYKLPAKYVIHTVGPVYHDEETDAAMLASCYRKSMNLALANNCHSIAFPCISTGVYGYPIPEAAQVSLLAVVNWLSEHPETVIDVYFCCFGEESLQAYHALANHSVPHSLPQDVQDLNQGSEAYQNGDYKTAIRLYEASAAAGNVTAMGNLGYCWYYGRSVAQDKAKAYYWWQRACTLGDICATYKLGDMARNGELPDAVPDENYAKQLYRRAYALALPTKDIDGYPDACLRLVKYDADGKSTDQLHELLKEAHAGFEARIASGDNYTKDLLTEVEELQSKLAKS